MSEETLAVRVENHERRLELLEALPARVSAVELQIVQLRIEMHEQFSTIRQEAAVANDALREGVHSVRTDLRAELATVRTGLRAEIKTEGEIIRSELRKEIRERDEETRRYMLVLHEEVLSGIAIIQEGLPRRRKR